MGRCRCCCRRRKVRQKMFIPRRRPLIPVLPLERERLTLGPLLGAYVGTLDQSIAATQACE
jgi:hypothetical protein